MIVDPASNFGDLSVGESEPALAALERRVQHLEEAVTALQEHQRAENSQVKVGAPPAENPPPPQEHVERRTFSDLPPARSSWLLVDILSEARIMVRMFFDIHFKMAWYTRPAVVILLLMILTSGLWLGWVPLLGFVLIKIWDLVLAFLIYKILSREARRYRETCRPL
jgi:hypothetical protein